MGNGEEKRGMGGEQNHRGGPVEMEKIAEKQVRDGENRRGKREDEHNW